MTTTNDQTHQSQVHNTQMPKAIYTMIMMFSVFTRSGRI